MDSQSLGVFTVALAMDKVIMIEKKSTNTTKDEKNTKTAAKKVSVGAWWKSTVEKDDSPKSESPTKESAKAATAKKPGKKPATRAKKGTTRKNDPSSSKDPSQDIVKEKESKPQQKRAPRKKKQAVSTAEKTPARKRSPRPKKSVSTPEEKSTTQVDVNVSQPEVDEKKTAVKKPVRKKPARRGRPAKKKEADKAPSPQTTAKKKESPLAVDPAIKPVEEKDDSKVAVNTEEGAETTTLPSEKKKKTPRKRAPRKRQAQKKTIDTSEEIGQQAEPADKDTEFEQQAVLAQVDSAEKREEAEQPLAADVEEGKGDGVETTPPSKPESQRPQKKQSEIKEQDSKKNEPKPIIKLLINAEEPEECRLALLEDGRLESIHVSTVSRAHTKNNIYKAKIVAIEANLQAAFVEYGTEKNGFLPFSEIHPEYYKQDVSDKNQKLIDQHQWKRLSIRDVLERGQEVLVQVVKEEVGTKGANMTTYLSLPGRCVVLMPGSDSTGISRKISGEERRSQLREYVKSITIPEGIGWIVRTASIDITKAALSRDVGYLLRLWEDVKKKGQDLEGEGLIYQDHNHVLRFLREHFDPDIQEILVDEQEALEQVKGFVELLPSKQRNVKIKLHRGARPIFNQYSIEDQIESIYQPKVNLPSGGSIVIDPTEALVAIDVNSGSTSKGHNFEESIFQANMEAAKELARQLRLRDLGGLIVIDFIDMRSKKNIREVERQVKTAMKRDKAKVDISRISKFGLMQISRQKLGAPIEAGNYQVCTNCKGRGVVRSVETLALYYLRRIHTGATRKVVNQVECHFPLDVAQYLLNYKRNELRDLEAKFDAEVIIIAEPSFKPADHEITFHKTEKDDSSQKRS